MKLFKFEAYKVMIEPEALALAPFRKIWNRDRSQSKERAFLELSYIYFMVDTRSDYQYLVDEEERHRAIIEGEGFPNTWKPDKLIQEAMDFYNGFKTTSALILEDTRYAADNLRKSLRSINLEATDEKGKPIYTVSSIISAIKQVPLLVKELSEAERAVSKELSEQSGRVRGQREKSLLEDGFDNI